MRNTRARHRDETPQSRKLEDFVAMEACDIADERIRSKWSRGARAELELKAVKRKVLGGARGRLKETVLR